jgi:hypothetical protein
MRIFQDHETADEVLQLPHVARPRIRGHLRHGLGKQVGAPLVLAVESAQKRRGQRDDGFRTFTKRWDLDLHDVQPIIEVFSELPPLHGDLEIPVRGGDHADVCADQLATTDAREPEVLQHVQQLRLQEAGHLPDLIEAQSSALGELEPPRFEAVRR